MSVVNKMLQDLENRQQDDNLEADYRPQSDAKRTRNLVLLVVTILLVAASYFTLRAIGFDKVEQQSRQWLTSIGLLESQEPSNVAAQPKVSVNQALEQIMPAKPQAVVEAAPAEAEEKVQQTVELANVLSDEVNEVMGAKNQESENTPIVSEPEKLSIIPSKSASAEEAEENVGTASDFSVVVTQNTPEQKAEYWRQEAQTALEENNDREAIEALNKLHQLLPEDTRVTRKLASLLFANGAENQAQGQLQQGLQLNSEAHDLRLMLSRIYFQQQQPQRAFDLLKSVQPEIALYPDFYSFKASLAQELQFNQVAYVSYQKLVAFEPHKAKWWLGMAIALDRQSSFPEALRAYQHAADLQQLSSASQSFAKQRIEALGG